MKISMDLRKRKKREKSRLKVMINSSNQIVKIMKHRVNHKVIHKESLKLSFQVKMIKAKTKLSQLKLNKLQLKRKRNLLKKTKKKKY